MAFWPVVQRLTPALAATISLACLGWCWFVDFQEGLAELIRVILGLTALWAPIGLVTFASLGDRVSDGLTRFTLSAAAAYALTPLFYALASLVGLWIPSCDRLFYWIEALLFGIGLTWLWRRNKSAETPARLSIAGATAWQKYLPSQVGWTLTLLVALSIFVTPRYKEAIQSLPDGSRRLIAHGDATYLAAQAYELDRAAPARQQAVRAGVKERAYHNYPHLTTMLVARYTGQDDLLRALMHYQFTIVEVLLCLMFFLIARSLTGSGWAGCLAVASLYLLAIPLPPLVENTLGCFYFTWHPHATSNIEGAVIASPQTYCALPVVFGVLLAALEFSVRLSRAKSLGAVAMLLGLMSAALLRYRVQTFLPLYPATLLLLAYGWRCAHQRILWAAGGVSMLLVAAQAGEMRLPLYYEDTCRLTLHTTGIMHTHTFLNAWPGAEPLRAWMQAHCGAKLFLHGWQVLCATMFALLNVAGVLTTIAALAHVARAANWRGDAWAFTALVLWLTVASIIGATCVGTTYDMYSVGGQMLLMVGWYLLPLLSVGVWRAAQQTLTLFPSLAAPLAMRWTGCGMVAGALVLASVCCWQRHRPPSELEQKLLTSGTRFSAAEWEAIQTIRRRTPPDAVVLTKVEHHDPFACVFSGVAGRRAYLEYLIDSHFAGGPTEDNPARKARIDRLWNATTDDEFARAVAATGATLLVEYDYRPLAVHPTQSLELCWASAEQEITVWKVYPQTTSSEPESETTNSFIAARRP